MMPEVAILALVATFAFVAALAFAAALVLAAALGFTAAVVFMDAPSSVPASPIHSSPAANEWTRSPVQERALLPKTICWLLKETPNDPTRRLRPQVITDGISYPDDRARWPISRRGLHSEVELPASSIWVPEGWQVRVSGSDSFGNQHQRLYEHGLHDFSHFDGVVEGTEPFNDHVTQVVVLADG